MGPIGMQEMIAVFVIALVLFGPKKLPELGRILGKGLSEFRRAKSELKSTFETHLHELERETQLPAISTSSTPDYSSSHYSYPYDEYGTHETGNSPETVPADNPIASHALESATPATDVHRLESASNGSPVPHTVPRGSTLQEEHPA